MHQRKPVLLFSIACLVVTACSSSPQTDVEQIKARGSLIMLSAPHQENPFVHTRVDVGAMPDEGTAAQFAGVDVELMKGFAETLGVELKVRPALGESGLPSYSALIPDLLAGEGDLIASSLSITPSRIEVVSFSVPYFSVVPVVVTRQGSEISSTDDLPGRLAGAIAGSSHEEILLGMGFEKSSIRYSDFALENYLDVAEGRVDFIIVDSNSAARFMLQFDELQIACEVSGRDDYGVAIRPESDLKPLLDEYLAQQRESGRVLELLEQFEPQVDVDDYGLEIDEEEE